jgi:hypothetical protein
MAHIVETRCLASPRESGTARVETGHARLYIISDPSVSIVPSVPGASARRDRDPPGGTETRCIASLRESARRRLQNSREDSDLNTETQRAQRKKKRHSVSFLPQCSPCRRARRSGRMRAMTCLRRPQRTCRAADFHAAEGKQTVRAPGFHVWESKHTRSGLGNRVSGVICTFRAPGFQESHVIYTFRAPGKPVLGSKYAFRDPGQHVWDCRAFSEPSDSMFGMPFTLSGHPESMFRMLFILSGHPENVFRMSFTLSGPPDFKNHISFTPSVAVDSMPRPPARCPRLRTPRFGAKKYCPRPRKA